MRLFLRKLWLFLFFTMPILAQGQEHTSPDHDVSVAWNTGPRTGRVLVSNGRIKKIKITTGNGKLSQSHAFKLTHCPCTIAISFDSAGVAPGPGATIVSVDESKSAFSFFLRDVNADFPIYMPSRNLAVFPSSTGYGYKQIETLVASKKLKTKAQKTEEEPEVSFESVSKKVRNQTAPTWLGLSRDVRHFLIQDITESSRGEVSVISPLNKSESVPYAGKSSNYSYVVGRGQGAAIFVERRLQDGYLPILHSLVRDEDVHYKTIQFASFERSTLDKEHNRGTHFLLADSLSAGHMLTTSQKQKLQEVLENEKSEEEIVLYFKITAVNTGSAPRYAWIKSIKPGRGWWDKTAYSYDAATGFSSFAADTIFSVAKMNGSPLPNEEIAVLLQPGDSVITEFFIPHSPLSKKRAIALSRQSFETRHEECSRYWRGKLDDVAQFELPEKRIEQMLKAGLFHLDLMTYGKEPSGTLAPTIGVYSPIGTESSPIIQYYASMGKYDWARRSLQYFLEKQHENGFMQNFGGYMVETGAVLWSIGEYFRYTRDTVWVEEIKDKLLLSVDYLLKWRSENKREDIRANGYGLISGKVADPEDHFHQFMLNGYAYLGLSRVSEMLNAIHAPEARRIAQETDQWKSDIRNAFFRSTSLSPVVPLGDGTWRSPTPPWTEATGLRSLYATQDAFFSHGTFTVSDALLGPLYLVFCEVISASEPAAKDLLDYHSELFHQDNAAFSQPYYSRHDWLQLKAGLVKNFIKTYYTQMASLADRETYTFWEHLYQVSSHKTHEEAWFLMATRWMLYMEEGNSLNLLSGVPRAWLNDGENITVRNASSYFGKISFQVQSDLKNNRIMATINIDSDRAPREVEIRLPHPQGKKPIEVKGGAYDANSESVKISNFKRSAAITLQF